jgi:RsiW-degrading membrane proteinase PrsW (M82 family)
LEILFALVASVLGAVVPTIFYAFIVRWMDPYEEEPFRLLALAFLWGAVPAIVLSLMGEFVLGIPLSVLQPSASTILGAAVVGPVVEEAAKGVALLFLVLAFRSEFDDVLDGIIYGAIVGLGFAMTENVAYFLSAFTRGIPAGFATIGTRTVLFGLNHAFFTALLGGAIGLARLSARSSLRYLAPPLGLLLAISFHSIHNLGVSLAELTCYFSFLVSVLSDGMGILLILLTVFLAWRQERRWIVEELEEEVRSGCLLPEEVSVVASAARRFTALTRTRREEGWDVSRQLRQFYQDATELAFKKRQRRLLGEEESAQARIEELRSRIKSMRASGILPASSLPHCCSCGGEVSTGDAFCQRCGVELSN